MGIMRKALFSLTIALVIISRPSLSLSSPSVLSNLMLAQKSVCLIISETAQVLRSDQTNSASQIAMTRVRPVYYSRQGMGILISNDGIVVVTLHTVKGAGRIRVQFPGQPEVRASVIDTLEDHDLALIRLERTVEVSPLRIGDSENLRLGEKVFAIGGSHILKGTLIQGKISGLGSRPPSVAEGLKISLIQVDFDTYPGDSGSPVLSGNASLLGLVSSASRSQHNSTYAIPSEVIQQRLNAFVDISK